MNLVLIGYRGSGKSVVGRRLADHLQMTFVDTDDLIEERQGIPIADIVKSRGWGHFRKLENKVIEEISKEDHLIIAPGGGAVLDTDNVKALRKRGTVIWLQADRQTLLKRMNQDPGTNTRRPSLTGKGTKGTSEELKEIMSFREPIYEKASEIQIDTSTLDVDTVVEQILTALKNKVGRI
ncbi:MAG TPA: shikimate kinase [Thermodesulfobacteriota bacterium]|nr:shikimate kinase [Thermodesulfobacteriota bacterium]